MKPSLLTAAVVIQFKSAQLCAVISTSTFALLAILSSLVSKKWLIPEAVSTVSANVSVLAHSASKSMPNARITKKTLFSVFFIACFFIPTLFAAAISDVAGCPQFADFPQAQFHRGQVRWLPDGDTVHTLAGEKLRLLHINTPEINATKPKPSEPFALAAKSKLAQLLGESGQIYWLTDAKAKDKYGRDLVLLFNAKGQFVNAELAAAGLAHMLVIPPNQRYWQCIYRAQQHARELKLGIWATPSVYARPLTLLRPNEGFQLIDGTISEIKPSSKQSWLILDNQVWVGIPNPDQVYFNDEQRAFKVGQKITLWGYLYLSHDKLRVKLHHPAMLLEPQSIKH